MRFLLWKKTLKTNATEVSPDEKAKNQEERLNDLLAKVEAQKNLLWEKWEALPEYDKAERDPCPKCGASSSILKFQSEYLVNQEAKYGPFWGMTQNSVLNNVSIHAETIQITCAVCGYHWQERIGEREVNNDNG